MEFRIKETVLFRLHGEFEGRWVKIKDTETNQNETFPYKRIKVDENNLTFNIRIYLETLDNLIVPIEEHFYDFGELEFFALLKLELKTALINFYKI